MKNLRILTIVLLVVLFLLCLAYPEPALATPEDDAALQGILAEYESPLPWWTAAAFLETHGDFDVAGYLAVAACESGFGKGGGSYEHNNPGNIVWGGLRDPDDPKVWLRWQCDKYWAGQWYGVYTSMYWGNRALIRLLYDSPYGYNDKLSAEDWYGFGIHYYGDKPGLSAYINNLAVWHDRIVKLAAKYGASW